jgi:hypothetical protein
MRHAEPQVMKAPAATPVAIDSLDLTSVTGAGIWSANRVYDPQSGKDIEVNEFKRRYGDVCARNSCYDSKSGHFVSRDEWNKFQIERQ